MGRPPTLLPAAGTVPCLLRGDGRGIFPIQSEEEHAAEQGRDIEADAAAKLGFEVEHTLARLSIVDAGGSK